MDFTPASCTSCCHVNLSKNSFSNTPETHNKCSFLKASAKVRPLSEMAKEKPKKKFRKMKNTLLLKTTIRRNILHTKEKEKHEVQRKKQRKERKIPATPKKNLR